MSFLPSETDLQQLVISLIKAMKHGKISVQTQGEENLHVEVEDRKISLNFLQEEKLKSLLRLGTQTGKASSSSSLQTFRNTAERLKQDGLTLVIFLKGKALITMGSGAHGTSSKIFAGTNHIEINDLAEIMRLLA